MVPLSARHRPGVRIITAVTGLVLALTLYLPIAALAQPAPASIARVGVRVISPPTNHTLVGSVFAVDQSGQPLDDVSATPLMATIDGSPVTLSFAGRPTIALGVGFWLDSSASPQVRDALANALADGLREVDINRDTRRHRQHGQHRRLGAGQLHVVGDRAAAEPERGHPGRAR